MRTLVPRWEELLIFNESFDHVKTDNGDDLAIFFLVQDFVSMNKVRERLRVSFYCESKLTSTRPTTGAGTSALAGTTWPGPSSSPSRPWPRARTTPRGR